MIYYLKGTLAFTDPNIAVVECAGVGYKCNVSNETLSKLHNIGSEVKLYTYMSIREDAIDLFGFYTLEEQNVFKQLISVSGIGPKGALSIISTLGSQGFARAVGTNNAKLIASAPGVGKKTAERIIVDLRDKLNVSQNDEETPNVIANLDNKGTAYADALEALVVLGYQRRDAIKALEGCDGNTVEDLMRQALLKINERMKK